MSLIVAGATGAIGRCVVREALKRNEFSRVVALTRSTFSDPADLFGFKVVTDESEAQNQDAITKEQLTRLFPVTFDWEKFLLFWQKHGDQRGVNTGNAATHVEEGSVNYNQIFGGHKYCAMCLGTTRRDAGSAKKFVRCDYDYVVAFASALRAFSGDTLVTYAQVSAQFANKDSWLLYSKTKGSADAAVEALQFPRLCVYRPSLLDRGAKTRFNERVAKWFVGALPVEICGQAIVSDFLHCHGSEAGGSSCGCAGKKQKTVSSDDTKTKAEVLFFSNSDIKKEAAHLH